MSARRYTIIVLIKIFNRISKSPATLYHLIYTISTLRRRAIRRRLFTIKDHKENLPTLTSEESLMANTLVHQGFCVTNSEFFSSFKSQDFWAAGNDIYDAIESHYFETGENIYITKLISTFPSLMNRFETIFRAGLDPSLLRVIEHYVQLPVAYGGVDIFFTVADGVERGARVWHKDGEDSPMIKVAVYFNDVCADDGPLQVLHLSQNLPKFGNMRPFKDSKLVCLQNRGEIEFQVTSFLGQKGTAILCDTSRYFHRGKPAAGKNRRALFFNYYANQPLSPYHCPPPPFSPDKMENVIFDLSTKQKNAAQWRDHLPKIYKIVARRKPYLGT